MNPEALNATKYLDKFTLEFPNRRTGSKNNLLATEYYANIMASLGYEIFAPEFDCIDWINNGAWMVTGGQTIKINPSPYSLPFKNQAELIVAQNIDELSGLVAKDKILLLTGELTKEQLMPKNFPFYSPEHHQKFYQILEDKKPLAIITATASNPEMAGGLTPFPMIEDGDFNIPSAFISDTTGQELIRFAGNEIYLEISTSRQHTKSANVLVKKNSLASHRLVITAHLDTKDGTPGAIDNAGGITILLLLADRLAKYNPELGIEIIAFNGEDYYSAPGQVQYIQSIQDRFAEIMLAINIDGAGYIRGKTAYSIYNCPDNLSNTIRKSFSNSPEFTEGEQWYQGDHTIFILNQRPALAITSAKAGELTRKYTHTPFDTKDLVDVMKLIEIVRALEILIIDLDMGL